MESQEKEKPEDSHMVAEMKINPTKREATTASRSEESLQKLTKNGSSTDRYHWSQTKVIMLKLVPLVSPGFLREIAVSSLSTQKG